MRGEVHIDRLVLHGLPPDVDVDRVVEAVEVSLADWLLAASPAGWSSTAEAKARPVRMTVTTADPTAWGAGIAAALGGALHTMAAAPAPVSPARSPVEG